MRRREARVLLDRGHDAAAYYLIGYSVECALKACICRQVRRHDFPDRSLAIKAYTHDLFQLVKVAGLQQALNERIAKSSAFGLKWNVVMDWSEQSRYNPNIPRALARDLYAACTSRRAGVLAWLRINW